MPSGVQFKTVKPTGQKILVKLGEPEKTTASGILLPSSAGTDKNEGVIVAIGEGKQLKVRIRERCHASAAECIIPF